MTEIADNLERIRDRIAAAAERSGRRGADITLVAVTKLQPVAAIQAVLDAGARHVGENYVPEAEGKFPQVAWPDGVTRHFIGHLQGNKAARAIEAFDVVQSVDSLKLARRLNQVAGERGVVLPVLVEAKLCDEPEKTGFNPETLLEVVEDLRGLSNLRVLGLMGMAPFTDEKKDVRLSFENLRKHFLTLHNDNMRTLSMGMTNDFEIAIEEGSTMVRIGTAIFGARTASFQES
jgi:pyridoxal phosphate enzyme (YggS family)